MRVSYPATPEQEAPCAHFGVCGGCRAQHLSYASQLAIKSEAVRELFADRLAADQSEFREIVGADTQFAYRNKVEFTFSNLPYLTREQIDSGESFSGGALGFHAPRFFAKAVDIDECLLTNDAVNRLRNTLREISREQDIAYYNTRSHEGVMRNFTVRSTMDGDLMLILVLGEDRPELARQLLTQLAQSEPSVRSGYWVFNNKKNSSVQDLEHQHVLGDRVLLERLGDAEFELQPAAFFQTNPAQAQRLYALVDSALDACLSAPTDVLYDLYCGAGSIGLFVRAHAKRIVGVDYVASAIEDATRNARRNDFAHAHYIAADMAKALDAAFFERHGQPEVIIVDPARPGMSEAVCERLNQSAASYILYISCNAESQLRDIDSLSQYRLQSLQVIDMFPQTPHTETLAVLTRRQDA